MKRKFAHLLVLPLAIVFAGLIAHSVLAEEAADPGKGTLTDALLSCNKWMNCDTESPNYTGVCCRTCKDARGQVDWDCKGASVESDRRDASDAGNVALGEATLTGIVTAEGVLKADDGHKYKIAGTRLQVDDLQRNMGKRVEVKGTVQESKGKVSVEVASYKSMNLGDAGGPAAIGSCTGWMNCDQRPPNFTGTCCRQCDDKQGAKVWDCKVFSEGEHFDTAEWSGAR
jgi:hypothetical protein